MKGKAILCLVGFMLFSTVLYLINRTVIKLGADRSKKKRKTRKNKRSHIKSNKGDWLEKRRQENWSDRFKDKNETELSELTTGYIQIMILLIFCLILLLIIVP
jgi:hypothetical protein